MTTKAKKTPAKKVTKKKDATTATKKVVAKKATKKERTAKRAEVQKDKFGFPVQTTKAKVNAVLSKEPQTRSEIAKAAGLRVPQVRYSHLERLTEAGQLEKTDKGWKVAKGTK